LADLIIADDKISVLVRPADGFASQDCVKWL